MADLKDIYSLQKLEEIASNVTTVEQTFSKEQFIQQVLAESWDELTLRQRHERLARCVYEGMTGSYSEKCTKLRELNSIAHGFSYLFLPDIVSMYGLEEVEESFQTLEVLTTGSSAEFAIRSFLTTDFNRTFAQMQRWATHENEHVRRLASEGLRLNLPWGKKIPDIEKHRQAIFELLESLMDDTSLYVRKSVANHFNDWTKQYPDEVLDVLSKWKGQAPEADWIIKHAVRTLLKEGQPESLALFGYRPYLHIKQVQFEPSTQFIQQGDSFTVSYEMEVIDPHESALRLALQVGFVKKNGKLSFKTFLLKDTHVSPHATVRGQWTYQWNDKTTRKHYNGAHVLQLVVNGRIVDEHIVNVEGF